MKYSQLFKEKKKTVQSKTVSAGSDDICKAMEMYDDRV